MDPAGVESRPVHIPGRVPAQEVWDEAIRGTLPIWPARLVSRVQ